MGRVIDSKLKGWGIYTILTAKNSLQKQGTKPLKLVFLKGSMRVKKFGWKISLKNEVPLDIKLQFNDRFTYKYL